MLQALASRFGNCVGLALLACSVATAALAQVAVDHQKLLAEADRLAWLTNWYDALPIYTEVERAASETGNRRDAMYAKFGRLRGQMQTVPLPDISAEIAAALDNPLAKGDARLRLRGLTVKGDIDLEWDIQAAQRDWEEVGQLARELGDTGWENRANGELGIVAFLKGNTGEATKLVQQAYQTAEKSGDIGGQLRYMATIANGLLLAGHVPLALEYVDRALKFASGHPDTGFPFAAYSTKVLTLLALKKPDEAESFAKAAMAEASAGDRRIKEIELSMMLAEIAEKRGQPEQAIVHLERAVATAKAGEVQRLLADVESELADAYRAHGDLKQALTHAAAAVSATTAAGGRFTLPERLRILADIYAIQGRVAEASRVYDQATDIVEGIMVNVPSRGAQARLVGVMSDIYTGHFRLAADHLNDPEKAYDIIERARGRVLADVLRTLPDDTGREARPTADQERAISRLQIRLMRAQTPSQRRALLEQLWEAEQQLRLQAATARVNPMVSGSRVGVRTFQQMLAPNELVLEYVLTEPQSYCLAIGRERLELAKLPSRAKVEMLVDRFVERVRAKNADRSSQAADLADAVLKPVAGWETAERLYVVPDGRLHLLPFQMLVTETAVKPPIVSSVPSANVFTLLRRERPTAPPERAFIGVGGVPYDRMFTSAKTGTGTNRSDETRGLFDAPYPTKLPVLPTAQREVLAAAQLLGPTSVVLTGDKATESALKGQRLDGFEVLHFAVHAFADPKFPERAALVLLNDPSTGDDGLLQPREIGQLKLNAGVVVLSACDTAVGPTLGQEGVLNLARAFLIAGAKSVVTTLWAVSDATSTAVMQRFYENIAAGMDVAEALARSKAAVLEQLGTDALSTVAAFQVVGLGGHRLQSGGSSQKNVSTSVGQQTIG